MYLIILEDGSVGKSDRVSDEELSACEDGYMQIIDIEPPNPLTYYNGKWNDIEDETQ